VSDPRGLKGNVRATPEVSEERATLEASEAEASEERATSEVD